jgi:hypothetical protein
MRIEQRRQELSGNNSQYQYDKWIVKFTKDLTVRFAKVDLIIEVICLILRHMNVGLFGKLHNFVWSVPGVVLFSGLVN